MLRPIDIPPKPARTATLLCVEPDEGDRQSLHDIIARSSWPMCPDLRWHMDDRASVQAAAFAVRRDRVPVVVCECLTPFGTWKEMLDLTNRLTDPPLLIVTSRLADDRLWAEALNLGAYDVLAKPFDVSEVVRVISVAWLTWRNRHAGAPDAARPLRKTPQSELVSRMMRGRVEKPTRSSVS